MNKQKSDPLDLHKNDGTKQWLAILCFFFVYLHEDGEHAEKETQKREIS